MKKKHSNHTFRTIIPGAKYVMFGREAKPGKDAGMTKSRHIWRMPKDIGFVTHYVNAGARRKWAAIIADGREPTTAERRKFLKRVPVYRGVDIRVARTMTAGMQRAKKLKARANSNRASSVLKSLLAGAS